MGGIERVLGVSETQRTDERRRSAYVIGASCRGESADAYPSLVSMLVAPLYFHDVFFQALHECDYLITFLLGNL